MIRNVSLRDAKAIVDIYNEYVVNSVATFETEPLRVEEMEGRIAGISASYPYLVYVDQDEVVGYCYAHTWKEKAAYKYTLETTVYLSPRYKGKGIGRQLMERLIEECRAGGYHALIACITNEGHTFIPSGDNYFELDNRVVVQKSIPLRESRAEIRAVAGRGRL